VVGYCGLCAGRLDLGPSDACDGASVFVAGLCACAMRAGRHLCVLGWAGLELGEAAH
jgi:hypothetical protein